MLMELSIIVMSEIHECFLQVWRCGIEIKLWKLLLLLNWWSHVYSVCFVFWTFVLKFKVEKSSVEYSSMCVLWVSRLLISFVHRTRHEPLVFILTLSERSYLCINIPSNLRWFVGKFKMRWKWKLQKEREKCYISLRPILRAPYILRWFLWSMSPHFVLAWLMTFI